MDSAAAADHPIGHAHQIPMEPKEVFDRTIARTTRRIRSVKVAIMNSFIIPAPRRMPSAANFAEITK